MGESGGLNIYGFAGNDSVNGRDYLGMKNLFNTTQDAAEALLKGWKGSDEDTINAVVEAYQAGKEWKSFYDNAKSAVDNDKLAVLAIIALKYDDKQLLEQVQKDVGVKLAEKALGAIGKTNPAVKYAVATGDAIGSTIGNIFAETFKLLHARQACLCCRLGADSSGESGEFDAGGYTCLATGKGEIKKIWAETLKPDLDNLSDGIAKNVIDLLGEPETYFKECSDFGL